MTGITGTIAVSAITSAVVSLTTFVIGVRLSKDQGDRPVLRALYQRLFEHFSRMRQSIEEGQPKAWSDFPYKANEFVSPFKEIQRSGEAAMLPPGLATDCERIEREALSAGSHLKRWLEVTYIPDVRGYLTVLVPRGKQPISGRRYRPMRASQLTSLSESDLAQFIDEVEQAQVGVGFELATERGRTDIWYLYSEYVSNGDWASIIWEAWRRSQKSPDAAKLHSDLRSVADHLDRLTPALKGRIRDPHPLLESVRRSLSDVIRGR